MMKCSTVSFFIVILSFLLLLTSCQPTPETPVVMGRDEEKLAAAMAQTSQPGEEAQPYDAPGHLTLEFDGLPDNYSIVFDADVQVPEQTQWPVYTVAKAHVTQQQADAVREALLGDTVLYKPEKNSGRGLIQHNINDYEEGLKSAIDAGEDQMADEIQKALKELYAEYEKAESSELEKANLTFAFMEDVVPVELYSDKRVELDHGCSRTIWTDEARAKAIAAGCESIHGFCTMDNGRKMQFLAKNDEDDPIVFLESTESMNTQEVSYSLDEAKTRADEMLKKMGLDFVLVYAETIQTYSDADATLKNTVNEGYLLMYKRQIDGVPQDYVLSGINQNISDEYKSAVPQQETVRIRLNEGGLVSFMWRPMEVIAQETKSAALLPFDDIKDRIAEQLKVQSIWDEQMENSEETNDIVSMRLEVNTIKLSYLLIDKQNDMDSYYLIPVWNVCGSLYYHYRNDYPAGVSEPFDIDENMERAAWGTFGQTHLYSVLTINALDGSVIPRDRLS